MAKGHWVVSYRKVLKPEQTAEYSRLATPATLTAVDVFWSVLWRMSYMIQVLRSAPLLSN